VLLAAATGARAIGHKLLPGTGASTIVSQGRLRVGTTIGCVGLCYPAVERRGGPWRIIDLLHEPLAARAPPTQVYSIIDIDYRVAFLTTAHISRAKSFVLSALSRWVASAVHIPIPPKPVASTAAYLTPIVPASSYVTRRL
jgi:hypothetical protein